MMIESLDGLRMVKYIMDRGPHLESKSFCCDAKDLNCGIWNKTTFIQTDTNNTTPPWTKLLIVETSKKV